MSIDRLEVWNKLKDVTPLRFFEKKDFQNILKFSAIQRYAAGETIIEEGSFDNRVFILISGSLNVVKKGEDITVIKRTGDIFGEMCVIDGTARSASICAAEASVCMSIDVSFIDTLSAADRITFSAVFYQILAEVLARRLREANEELVRTKEELFTLKNP
jgi:CRP/FNR family transcriptional regulator, cyclic AMP receptor protein